MAGGTDPHAKTAPWIEGAPCVEQINIAQTPRRTPTVASQARAGGGNGSRAQASRDAGANRYRPRPWWTRKRTPGPLGQAPPTGNQALAASHWAARHARHALFRRRVASRSSEWRRRDRHRVDPALAATRGREWCRPPSRRGAVPRRGVRSSVSSIRDAAWRSPIGAARRLETGPQGRWRRGPLEARRAFPGGDAPPALPVQLGELTSTPS